MSLFSLLWLTMCGGTIYYALRRFYLLTRTTKKWRRQNRLMRITVQPMNEYLILTEKAGELYSDEGYRQFLAERGMDFDSWLALAEIVHEGIERELRTLTQEETT